MARSSLPRGEVMRIYDAYIKHTERTAGDIAASYYMSPENMYRCFRMYGLPTARTAGRPRKPRRAMPNRRCALAPEQILAMYYDYCIDLSVCAADIASRYYVCYDTMLICFARYGLPLVRRRHRHGRADGGARDEIFKLHSAGLTHRQIAARVRLSRTSICRILHNKRRCVNV